MSASPRFLSEHSSSTSASFSSLSSFVARVASNASRASASRRDDASSSDARSVLSTAAARCVDA